ncbi:MAG: electron transfer flavoprotein subunit alpha/FixB family protein [Thermotogota bacterium]
MNQSVMVYTEIRNGSIHPVSYELTGKARELANKLNSEVVVVALFETLVEKADAFFSFGADKVIVSQDECFSHFNQQIHTNVLSAIIKKEQPQIVLAPATTGGRTVLPAVAGTIHTGLTADCTGLDIEAETGLLLQTRPAIGGNIMATIKTPQHRPQMATVRPKTFKIPKKSERRGVVELFKVRDDMKQTTIEVLDFQPLEAGSENIQDKEIIVSGGKGLKRKEGFDLLKQLADLLQAAIGASRPTIEAKWIDYPHQVGLSGKVVSPKLYFAIGISGAVQHIAGMESSEIIVSVNKDPDASIFQVSDYAFCGDLYDVVPKLIEILKEKLSDQSEIGEGESRVQ